MRGVDTKASEPKALKAPGPQRANSCLAPPLWSPSTCQRPQSDDQLLHLAQVRPAQGATRQVLFHRRCLKNREVSQGVQS